MKTTLILHTTTVFTSLVVLLLTKDAQFSFFSLISNLKDLKVNTAILG